MTEPTPPANVKTSPWRDKATKRIPPEAARRQGDVTSLALSLLGDHKAAIAFLNTHSAELDGRPLDLAVESVAGSERVQLEIRRLASGG